MKQTRKYSIVITTIGWWGSKWAGAHFRFSGDGRHHRGGDIWVDTWINSSSNYTRFSLHVSVTPIMALSPVAADSATMAEGQCPLIDPKSKEKLCTRPEVGSFSCPLHQLHHQYHYSYTITAANNHMNLFKWLYCARQCPRYIMGFTSLVLSLPSLSRQKLGDREYRYFVQGHRTQKQ